MAGVVFVAPFFLATTTRFIGAVASVPGVRLGVVSQDPLEALPDEVTSKLAGHYQVGDALDPEHIARAAKALAPTLGGLDKLVGALEELQVPLAHVRQHLGLEGLDVETAHNFRDKERMKTVLDRAGIPVAKHRLAGTAEQARDFVQSVGLPIVVKPPSGSGTRDTFRIDSVEQLEDWLGTSPPTPHRPVLLEEFVVGEEHAFDCVFVDGRPRWWNITRYHPTPLEVMGNPWIQWAAILPRDIDGPEYAEIGSAGPTAIAALGLETGLVHMEWFRRPDGTIAVSEAAVRPPGAQFTTLISYAHDFDLYAAWAGLMVFGGFEPPERRYAVGAAYLRGQGSGSVKAIHGLEDAQKAVSGLVVEVKLPRPGQPSSGHYEGEGYVIVRHPDTRVVEDAIAAIINNVRVELA